MTLADRFYVTTPIYYLNADPHIGHAYTTMLADALTRYQQLFGTETFFLTGTDEHGQKVEEAAAKRGKSPLEHVNDLSQAFRDLWPTLNIEYDDFIRTTEERHKRVVRHCLQTLFDRGDIYVKDYEGWYSTSEERFWTEKDLVDGKCPASGNPVTKITERNYFFRMSRYGDALRQHIEANPGFIYPTSRANEVLGFLDKGLEDLCISRPKARLSWGIELPFDPDYVTYVWFDALLNYATGLDMLEDPERFASWWPQSHHIIGKDILTTHSVYWTTTLLALGIQLPKQIIAHGWWLQEDRKMGKSVGNAISPLEVGEKYGAEVLRFFLLRDMVVGLDASFSEAALVRRNNSDLANDLGNLARRVAGLVDRYFGGKVPTPGPRGELEAAIESQAEALVPKVKSLIGELKVHAAIEETMQFVRALNKYMTDTAPFRTVKTDPTLAATALYTVLEGLRYAAVMLQPVMPRKMPELLVGIGADSQLPLFSELSWGTLASGRSIAMTKGLFPRADMPKTDAAAPPVDPKKSPAEDAPTAKAGQAKAEGKTGETIPFDAFMRVDLKVATVLSCERVSGSEKLLCFQLDLGSETRQVVSGVAAHVDPAHVVGQQVVLVANLAPRKIFKVQSQGMILTTETPEGGLALLKPSAPAPPGSKVA